MPGQCYVTNHILYTYRKPRLNSKILFLDYTLPTEIFAKYIVNQ